MLPGAVLAHDMRDMPTSDGERVGDQGTMAAPGERLGAHDRSFLMASTLLKLGQARAKGRGCHIVSKPAKGGIAPARVRRIFHRMA